MLRLVTTNNTEVFRHLGNSSFKRLNVDHRIASSYDEALAAIREVRPTVALLDIDLAGGSGFDLCRAIKDDKDIESTHVSLLLTSVITRDTLQHIERSGCDDVLALPLHTDDFYHHVAQIAGLPFRRNRRVGVSLEIALTGRGSAVHGSVHNVSASGVGVQLPVEVTQGDELVIRFTHDGTVFPSCLAQVAWARSASVPGEYEAGLSFAADTPVQTRVLLEQLALYDVSPAQDESPMAGGVTVALQGDFTEITDFTELAARLQDETRIDFDAGAVRYISSAGVRSWCNLLGELAGKEYTFRHCSMAFATQAAMVPMVVGTGEVLSLEAPYFCESCDREEVRLLETGALLRERDVIVPPQLSCNHCGGSLEFDDVPDRFFAFLPSQD